MIGKLPGHGDFVARGVGSGERQQIDEWLAASMAAAREELGDKFEAAFDIAPPWRFRALLLLIVAASALIGVGG